MNSCYKKSKFIESNSPLSLSFISGITNNAIKDKVINGAVNLEPSSYLAKLFRIIYCFIISSAGKLLINPAIGKGSEYTFLLW